MNQNEEELSSSLKVVSLERLVELSKIKRVLMMQWRDLEAPDSGGSEIYTHEIASRLAHGGLDITLRTSNVEGLPDYEVRNGYRVIRKSGRYSIFVRNVLEATLGRYGPFDGVIEIWNGMPFLTPIWSRVSRVAVLHHIHGEIVWRHVLPPILAKGGAYFETRIAPKLYRNTPIIVPSKSSANEVSDIMKWPEHLISIVHPGINYMFRPKCKKSDNPTVVTACRLVKSKRVDQLIKAIDELRRESRLDIELKVIGRGAEYGSLMQLISDLNASNWCKLTGKISADQLVVEFSQAWVIASMSEKEGWGMTLTEAAACATPAVASKITGHEDAVIHGVSGFLASDFAEFKAYLKRVLEDEELRKRLELGSLRHAATLTWEASATRVFQVLTTSYRKSRSVSRLSPSNFSNIPLEKRGAKRYRINQIAEINGVTGLVKDISKTGSLVILPEKYSFDFGDDAEFPVYIGGEELGLSGKIIRISQATGELEYPKISKGKMSAVGIWLTNPILDLEERLGFNEVHTDNQER